jgi:hypothetical protein
MAKGWRVLRHKAGGKGVASATMSSRPKLVEGCPHTSRPISASPPSSSAIPTNSLASTLSASKLKALFRNLIASSKFDCPSKICAFSTAVSSVADDSRAKDESVERRTNQALSIRSIRRSCRTSFTLIFRLLDPSSSFLLCSRHVRR